MRRTSAPLTYNRWPAQSSAGSFDRVVAGPMLWRLLQDSRGVGNMAGIAGIHATVGARAARRRSFSPPLRRR